jgi:hypothetical protein
MGVSGSALEQPGADAEAATHAGWVYRKGGVLGQTWELKYFVLQRDPTDNSVCLFAYKDGGFNGKLAKGAVPLAKLGISGGTLEEFADSKTTWFSFVVHAPNGKAHAFRVAQADDRAAWCQKIREAIERL